jgi:hypothetical protein
MRNTLRLAVLACVAAGALATAGSALAVPKLIIGGLTTLGSSQVTVQFTEEKSDTAPARIVIYAAAGYSGTVTATPNTVLGTVHADLQALAISPDAIIQADGQIIAANPADFVGPPNNSCSPGTHTAVWLLRVTVSGQTINVPAYVDSPIPAGDALAGTAPVRITLCFSSPYIPTAMGGAPFGVKIINARMTLNQGVLRTPSTGGAFLWRTVVTPYTVNTGAIDVAGTIEARGIVRTPQQLTISARVLNKKKRQVRITGVLRAGNAGVSGATVRLTGGARGTARTNAGGTATFTLRFKKKGTYSLRLTSTVQPFDATTQGCATPTAPTLRCVSATVSGFSMTSRTLRIKL